MIQMLMPAIAAGIGSLGNIAGSLLGASASSKGQEEANEFNAQQAQINRDFQERMSRNAHTYEVEDLRRAGLNPILSANSGAPMAMGSTAVAQNTKAPYQDVAGKVISSAKTLADTKLTGEMAKTEQTKQKYNWKQSELLDKEIKKADLDIALMGNAKSVSDIETGWKKGWVYKNLHMPLQSYGSSISGILGGLLGAANAAGRSQDSERRKLYK